MRSAALAILLSYSGVIVAQERTHDITPDDYFTLKTITEIAVSPDGKQVAYVLGSWNEAANGRRTDLWVVATDGKSPPVALTKDGAGYKNPKWTADGKAVLVQTSRRPPAGKDFSQGSQVWKVPLEGDAEPLSRAIGGIEGFDYAPNADALFYTVEAKATDTDDFTKLRQKFTAPEYGSGSRTVSEVMRLRLPDGKPEKVIAEKRYIHEFAVTADGKKVAMIAAPDDTVLRAEGGSTVDVWEGETNKVVNTDQGWKKSAASPWPWLENLAWNPAGTRLAYCCIHDAYPAEIIVCEAKGADWNSTRVIRTGDSQVHGYGSRLCWRSNNTVIAQSDQAGSVGFLTCAPLAPGGWCVVGETSFGNYSREAVIYAFDVTPRDVAAVWSTANEFADLYTVSVQDGDVERVRLTDLNPQTKTWKLPTVQHITWKAPDGSRVGGVLELPFGFKKGEKKLPLVLAMHGGPTTASHADLEFDPHNGRLYLAAQGYAVLCPNYRGSTGYGDKFVTDLVGNENDIEVKDILAGIQHLVDEGIVDPERVGVMGWSNGGYLTNCLITLKDSPFKFKAASSGAGILDTVAEWGFNDEPAYPRVFKKGLPWETPEIYRKTSPTYGLGNVTTPTLIHVGGEDVRCPPGHSRMLHRALKEYVKVPTELIVYTGEPHGLSKYANRKAKMEWDIAWFEKYLK